VLCEGRTASVLLGEFHGVVDDGVEGGTGAVPMKWVERKGREGGREE